MFIDNVKQLPKMLSVQLATGLSVLSGVYAVAPALQVLLPAPTFAAITGFLGVAITLGRAIKQGLDSVQN